MCTACGTSEKHHDHDHDHEGHNHEMEEHNHEAEEHEHSTDEIVFEHSKAEKMGVKSILISPTPFNSIIKVSGERCLGAIGWHCKIFQEHHCRQQSECRSNNLLDFRR